MAVCSHIILLLHCLYRFHPHWLLTVFPKTTFPVILSYINSTPHTIKMSIPAKTSPTIVRNVYAIIIRFFLFCLFRFIIQQVFRSYIGLKLLFYILDSECNSFVSFQLFFQNHEKFFKKTAGITLPFRTYTRSY